jgi:predicted GIY-YIG superfamily endonuclease
MPVKEHEHMINSKFTSKLEELNLKLKQAEGDRDAQMEEVYRVRRLMREEKEQKEEIAYRFDKEKRARETLEA